ncbi:tyrosine-type recombinase/integrase [Vibrio ostreicida]|uniref:Tyrosine-type recombinase/integrase n=1 Tax=Vibrio ostreicida TaxID=526588 RepID=A0ABT8BY91_9VIBR|nr:tyrosine-type recombinase/integrase [Vibrio ostreicida]MDN3611623.1 tyrosine-type recombinase/integrase [Vibrio ostreicida]NPD09113.1 tyrosine-type recombinase/integrase [Vibrio ostreicida]
MRKNIRPITDLSLKDVLIPQFGRPITIGDLNKLTVEQYAKNSLLAMTKDWNLFTHFCRHKSLSPLPAQASTVRMFLEQESQDRKYATLRRYNVTISLVHRIFGLDDITQHAAVQQALGQFRIDKAGDAKSTIPFERHHLISLTDKLEQSLCPKVIRDLAIYHIMFECMLKRSELKRLTPNHLQVIDAQLHVALGDHLYRLSSTAQSQVERWLKSKPVDHPFLFSAIDKHGNIAMEALDDSSIYRILRAASEKLRLNVAFSGQSLRVGAVKDMSRRGAKTKDIQHFGRWLSPAMPYQYLGNKNIADAEKMVFKRFKPWS